MLDPGRPHQGTRRGSCRRPGPQAGRGMLDGSLDQAVGPPGTVLDSGQVGFQNSSVSCS